MDEKKNDQIVTDEELKQFQLGHPVDINVDISNLIILIRNELNIVDGKLDHYKPELKKKIKKNLNQILNAIVNIRKQ